MDEAFAADGNFDHTKQEALPESNRKGWGIM